MSYPFAPARFTAAETLADAWALAGSAADDRAFYVREDAAALARMEADRFASVDGLAMVRASLARHVAEYLARVRRASELTEEMQAQGVPFHDGSKPEAGEDAAALAKMQAVLVALDACNGAGVEAPAYLLVAMRGAFQVGGC